MDDVIDGSPTQKSQKKRKKIPKCRSLKMFKTEQGNNSEIDVESNTRLTKSQQYDPVEAPGRPSNNLSRHDILKNVHLLEMANKLSVPSQKTRTFDRCNNNRVGFLKLTDLASQHQQSTSAGTSDFFSNIESTTVMPTQWEITESQCGRIDVIVGNYYDSTIMPPPDGTNDEVSMAEKSNDVQPVTSISNGVNDTTMETEENTDAGPNSLKRHSAVVQSILYDWPTSPVKRKKTQIDRTCLSPKFVFNKRLLRRTYRKQRSRDTKPTTIPSPATVSASCGPTGFHSDEQNIRQEIFPGKVVPTSVNEEEVDLNESIHVIDNLQYLSNFYSQSESPVPDAINDNVNETFKSVMDLKSLRLTQPSRSLCEEEDFLGFDNQSITISERFDGFVYESDDSTFRNQREYYLRKDANLVNKSDYIEEPTASTSTLSDDLLNEKKSKELPHMKIRTSVVGFGVNETAKKAVNMFEDIEREYEVEFVRANNTFENQRTEFDIQQNYKDLKYPSFVSARGNRIPVSSAMISKKTNIFQNVTVTEDDLKCTSNWIGETDRNSSTKIVGLTESFAKPFVQSPTIITPNGAYPSFATARGNHIPVSSTVISKKTNIFENVSVTEDDLKYAFSCVGDTDRRSITKIDGLSDSFAKPAALKRSTAETRPNGTYPSFATARGNHIPVSSTMISKKTNIFQNLSVTEDDLKCTSNWIDDTSRNVDNKTSSSENFAKPSVLNQINPNEKYPSFTTARGNVIPVSSTMISKKTNIFENVSVTEDDLMYASNCVGDADRRSVTKIDELSESFAKQSKQGTTESGPNGTIPSFAIAKGNHIPVSSTISKPSSTAINHNSPYPSFATAGGRCIPVSSAMISKKTNIFDNLTIADDELQTTANWFGERSSAQHHSNISEDDEVQRNGKVIDRLHNGLGDDFTEGTDFQQPGSALNAKSCAGFSTGWGRPITVSESSICNLANIFDEDNQLSSTGLFREVTNLSDHAQSESDFLSKGKTVKSKGGRSIVNTFIKPSPLRKMSMVNSLRKLELESAKENVDAKSPLPLANATTSSIMHTPTSSISHIIVTPKSLTQECREIQEVILKDDELSNGFMDFISASSTPVHKADNHRNRPKQTRLVEKFDDIAGNEYFDSNDQIDTMKVRAPPDIISLRKRALEIQRQSGTGKTNVKPVPSTLFVRKLASSKLKWKDFVDNNRPVNRFVVESTESNHTNNVLNVTSENATEFKFNACEHFSEEFCRENVNGIYLKDDIVVMMDENCQIGLTEISAAFLSCPSVDPKLIHHKWIENHFKWILIKLAGMERSFPHRFGGRTLTLENLMLQMKYRYDIEIDQAERSAIRKICEMDDTAAKRMILFVARINMENYKYEAELSDGWYSLLSTFDYEMTNLVKKGTIKVGTKLVVQGAEVIGLESGSYPLDVPSNVRLNICANSARRARWDAKLGYCRNPEPFTISLCSVLAGGGSITKLKVCVVRVYPVVYFSSKGSDIYSEKVERRRSKNEDQDLSRMAEKIYSQVCKEYEKEEKSARHDNRPKDVPKLADISTITDPAILCYLLDEDKDPARIEEEMTASQKTMVLSYRDKLNCSRNEAIINKVKEMLPSIDKEKPKFTPLLKFKVMDEVSLDKTAVVTIWRPTEDDFHQIQEGAVYEMTGTGVRGNTMNELQIYVGRNANLKKLDAERFQMPAKYFRRHTSISEILSIDQPIFNELDTTGIVVHVGDISSSFQPAYIADGEQNIICIYFWQDIKDFAYDDIVRPKRFLAIKNLQWRPNSNSKPMPCAYATEYTIFTENPQSGDLLDAMTNLQLKFQTINAGEFFHLCMEKIKSHKSASTSTPVRSSSSSYPMSSTESPATSLSRTHTAISQLNGQSTLSVQSRIERLSKFADASPPTPPLQIKSLNKNYKLPAIRD